MARRNDAQQDTRPGNSNAESPHQGIREAHSARTGRPCGRAGDSLGDRAAIWTRLGCVRRDPAHSRGCLRRKRPRRITAGRSSPPARERVPATASGSDPVGDGGARGGCGQHTGIPAECCRDLDRSACWHGSRWDKYDSIQPSAVGRAVRRRRSGYGLASAPVTSSVARGRAPGPTAPRRRTSGLRGQRCRARHPRCDVPPTQRAARGASRQRVVSARREALRGSSLHFDLPG